MSGGHSYYSGSHAYTMEFTPQHNLSLSLCSAEALLGGPNRASSQPPCASRLHDPAPMFVFREERGDFLG